MKHRFLPIVPLLILFFLAACSPQAQTETAGQVEPANLDRAGLLAALEAAGAQVETGQTLPRSFFSVDAQVLQVNGVNVQVYEYPSSDAMNEDAAEISPEGDMVGSTVVMWLDAPHFFKQGRVLVLYVGSDNAMVDLLSGVLGEQLAGQ